MKRTTKSVQSSSTPTRLSLTSEKVRVLTASELQGIAGGISVRCRPLSCGAVTDATAG